jgi:hypothetical protein
MKSGGNKKLISNEESRKGGLCTDFLLFSLTHFLVILSSSPRLRLSMATASRNIEFHLTDTGEWATTERFEAVLALHDSLFCMNAPAHVTAWDEARQQITEVFDAPLATFPSRRKVKVVLCHVKGWKIEFDLGQDEKEGDEAEGKGGKDIPDEPLSLTLDAIVSALEPFAMTAKDLMARPRFKLEYQTKPSLAECRLSIASTPTEVTLCFVEHPDMARMRQVQADAEAAQAHSTQADVDNDTTQVSQSKATKKRKQSSE